MNVVNLKKQISCSVDEAIKRIEASLKTEGFGILTRIDFHTKMKEKLNKDIPSTVILGDVELVNLAKEADDQLKRVLEKL